MNTLKVEIVIPDWVNWIAVDKDGSVWGYETEPRAIQFGQWDTLSGLSIEEILYRTKPPKNWKDELYTWS